MTSNQRYLVIIPTYNEVENIGKLIPVVLEQHRDLDILVVDDNSPDGTAETVSNWMKKSKRIRLLRREER